MNNETSYREEKSPQYKKRRSAPIVWIILLLLIVASVPLFVFKSNIISMLDRASVPVSSSGYQAVFMSNGQVYFGSIEKISTDTIVLKDIFYLQVVDPIQGTSATALQTLENQPKVSLIKLGNELHGPEDVMYINRSQVLFYESLKVGSNIVKNIKDYKAEQIKK